MYLGDLAKAFHERPMEPTWVLVQDDPEQTPRWYRDTEPYADGSGDFDDMTFALAVML